MTTGAPIYLVSACASGEEFVAAFRRYADKNGLFIPIAAPLPAGRRGRFAVTLRDGGVMIEGEADIVSAGTTPSVLHGRVGMTLRFLEPDIKSKTVLVELEQARLALKPQPPSVPPRPAEVPAEPRPVVPAPSGRIDANNARAECVAIGDPATLVEVAPQPVKPGPKFVVPSIPPVGSRPHSASTPPLASPIVERRPPSPSTPPPRPATPSQPPPPVPPLPASRGDTPTAIATPILTPPGSITAVEPPPITAADASVSAPVEVEEHRDTIAMPALVPVPQARDAEIIAAVVPPARDSDTFPVTAIPTAASEPTQQAVPEPVAASSSGSISKPNGSRANLPPPRRTSSTNPPPRVRTPTPAAPMPALSLATRSPTPLGVPLAQAKAPASGEIKPPPVEVPKPPIVADPPPAVPMPDASEEPTDITSVPIAIDEPTASGPPPEPPPEAPEPSTPAPAKPAVPGGMRKTVLGVAVVPSGIHVLPAAPAAKPDDDGARDTALMEAAAPTKGIVGPRTVDGRAATSPPEAESESGDPTEPVAAIEPAARPPVIEEPSGDWTMVPGEAAPTIIPRKPAEEKKPDDETKLPTGNWTIARVEDSPDGWSEPSKVDVAPLHAHARAHTGPPVPVVSGEKPLEVTQTAREFEIEEETKSGQKIEIDASLPVERISGAVAVPVAAAAQAMQPAAPVAPPPPMPPAMAPPVMPAATPPPVVVAPIAHAQPPAASGSFSDFQRPTAAGLFGETLRVGDSTSVLESRRRTRLIVIGVSAAVAVAIGIVLLIVLTRADKSNVTTTVHGSAYVVGGSNAPATPDAAQAARESPAPVVDAAAAEPDDAVEAVAPPTAPKQPADGPCVVEVTSAPNGADILRDKEVVGTTPAELVLPCGEPVKLVLRKARFANASRTVTPKPEGVKVRASLPRPMLSVKVTSSPPGATIFLQGKSLGVTPGVVKLPAYEASTLMISKPGFVNENHKITPKQNNQGIHVKLKSKRGR